MMAAPSMIVPPADEAAPEPVIIPRREPVAWCKHVCCLMYLLAERLGHHPLLILTLRGMPETDLAERLRQHRALAGLQRTGNGVVAGPSPVYIAHVPRASGSTAARSRWRTSPAISGRPRTPQLSSNSTSQSARRK